MTTSKPFSSLILRIFQNPLTLFIAMGLGVLTGGYNPEFGKMLAPYATMLIDLMKMCVLPIVIASVSLSVAKLLTSLASLHFSKTLITIAVAFILCSILGVLVAVLTQAGESIDPDTSSFFKSLAVQVSIIEKGVTEALDPKELNFLAFITEAVPNNIFTSLASDKVFQVLIFSLIFGGSLAYIKPEPRQPVLLLCEALLQAFDKIFYSISIALPFVIFTLSAQTMRIGMDALLQMISYLLYFYLGAGILFFFSLLTIKVSSGISYREVLRRLRYPYFIAFATSNSIAAIPAATEALIDGFKVKHDTASFLVPLGIIIGRYGTIFFFAFTVIFMLQLYHLTLTPVQYAFVILGTIIAGISATGSPPPVALSMLKLVADPLGLPSELLFTVIIAIYPLIDPFVALLTVSTNIATTTVVARYQPKDEEVII